MNELKIMSLVASFGLIISCTKSENTVAFSDFPIIEGYLIPGEILTINISRQLAFSEDVVYSNDDSDNLTVTATVENSEFVLTAIGNGIYVDSNVVIEEGQDWDFSFSFNDQNVSGYTYIPAKPLDFELSVTELYLDKRDTTSGPPAPTTEVDPVVVSWTNLDVSNYLVLIENMESDPEPIIELREGEERPERVFRKEPRNDNSQEITFNEFQYFGTHRIILYHVLPDYATLYEENSNSSLNLTNPSTSIENGYGIFTGINADTLYLEVIEN